MDIPADVPNAMRNDYKRNYLAATKNTGKLMLFAGDQKIEHLNDDFYGTTKEGFKISLDDNDPEHLFRIASSGTIGVFAAQLGMISRYAADYLNINYLVKLNSKTNLAKDEPLSTTMVDLQDVMDFKKNSRVNVVGIGYTVYLGSEHENQMLKEAGRLVTWAHQKGLITVLWMYPRGKAVKDEKDPHLIAGAAGVGLCLGSDFVKINYPKKEGMSETQRAESFKEAVKAAGRTKVITAGGDSKDVKAFLQETCNQITISGCMGNATGRNIHQKPLQDAIRMCDAISAITLGDKDVDFAYKVYQGEVKFKLK
jgi:fructose-bisphosphate aldolase/6-deoxy-5-ketofructose 1-phosphate synthase